VVGRYHAGKFRDYREWSQSQAQGGHQDGFQNKLVMGVNICLKLRLVVFTLASRCPLARATVKKVRSCAVFAWPRFCAAYLSGGNGRLDGISDAWFVDH
jgi:hypothetical protein